MNGAAVGEVGLYGRAALRLKRSAPIGGQRLNRSDGVSTRAIVGVATASCNDFPKDRRFVYPIVYPAALFRAIRRQEYFKKPLRHSDKCTGWPIPCPLNPRKRTLELSREMSALCGGFNRSTQHLLILLEKEVCDGGDCTDMVHVAAEG